MMGARVGGAGPVTGSGSRAHRTLPAYRVVRSAHSAWRVPGGTRGSRTTLSPVPPAPPPEARAS